MKKIINPCRCELYNGKKYRGFVEIEYKEGRLSLSGVVGPMTNGKCMGSSGQCVDSIREGIPTEKWTDEMLQKLCDIWERWHLNDMNPYCEHQKELGWDELAKKKVTLYHYTLNAEAQRKKRDAESEARKALKEGKTFTPSEEQVFFANLPYSLTKHEKLNVEEEKNYEPRKESFTGYSGPTEIESLGMLKPEDHPEGILTKECPVCGYKYGTAWKIEEIPEEVIEWLFSLPDTEVQPAWV